MRQRNLSVGDPYLTATEAAELLSVSRATAHRAIQVLAERGLLVSRRRAGTFVGPGFVSGLATPASAGCVTVIIAVQRVRGASFFGDLMGALYDALPGRQVLVQYVSDDASVEQACELVMECTDPSAGFLLLACPRSIQEAALQAGVHAVALGSLYPTASSLPSVSIDNFERGRLLACHVTEQGHQRIGLLMPETWLPGDTVIFEGINAGLAESKVSPGALMLRNTAFEPHSVLAEVETLLDAEDAPTAIICRSAMVEPMLDLLKKVDVQLFIDAPDIDPALADRYTHVVSEVSFKNRVIEMAGMLNELMSGNSLDQSHVLYPPRIVVPG